MMTIAAGKIDLIAEVSRTSPPSEKRFTGFMRSTRMMYSSEPASEARMAINVPWAPKDPSVAVPVVIPDKIKKHTRATIIIPPECDLASELFRRLY